MAQMYQSEVDALLKKYDSIMEESNTLILQLDAEINSLQEEIDNNFPGGAPDPSDAEATATWDKLQEAKAKAGEALADAEENFQVAEEDKGRLQGQIESGEITVVADPTYDVNSAFYQIGVKTKELYDKIDSDLNVALTDKTNEVISKDDMIYNNHVSEMNLTTAEINRIMEEQIANMDAQFNATAASAINGIFITTEGSVSEAIDQRELPEDVKAALSTLTAGDLDDFTNNIQEGLVNNLQALMNTYASPSEAASNYAQALLSQIESTHVDVNGHYDDITETLTGGLMGDLEQAIKYLQKITDVRGFTPSLTNAEYEAQLTELTERHAEGELTDGDFIRAKVELWETYNDAAAITDATRRSGIWASGYNFQVVPKVAKRLVESTQIIQEVTQDGEDWKVLKSDLEKAVEVNAARREKNSKVLADLQTENEAAEVEFKTALIDIDQKIAESEDAYQVALEDYNAEPDGDLKAGKATIVVDAMYTVMEQKMVKASLRLTETGRTAIFNHNWSKFHGEKRELEEAQEILADAMTISSEVSGKYDDFENYVKTQLLKDNGVHEPERKIAALVALDSEWQTPEKLEQAQIDMHDRYFAIQHRPDRGILASTTVLNSLESISNAFPGSLS